MQGDGGHGEADKRAQKIGRRIERFERPIGDKDLCELQRHADHAGQKRERGQLTKAMAKGDRADRHAAEQEKMGEPVGNRDRYGERRQEGASNPHPGQAPERTAY